jgi:hypothetical protein
MPVKSAIAFHVGMSAGTYIGKRSGKIDSGRGRAKASKEAVLF